MLRETVESNDILHLFFYVTDGYIFVYSPGIVQHLLNVSPEFRSCHHVALDPAEVDFSCSNDKPTSSKLEYITCGGTSRSGGEYHGHSDIF